MHIMFHAQQVTPARDHKVINHQILAENPAQRSQNKYPHHPFLARTHGPHGFQFISDQLPAARNAFTHPEELHQVYPNNRKKYNHQGKADFQPGKKTERGGFREHFGEYARKDHIGG